MSDAVIIGFAVLAVLVSLALGVWWGLRMQRRAKARLGISDLSWKETRRVCKRARNGPVPDDPDERARVLEMVRGMQDNQREMMKWTVPVLGILLLLEVAVLVLDPTVLRAVTVGFFVLMLCLVPYERRVLARRVAALTPR